jgi:hypothetical protein
MFRCTKFRRMRKIRKVRQAFGKRTVRRSDKNSESEAACLLEPHLISDAETNALTIDRRSQ